MVMSCQAVIYKAAVDLVFVFLGQELQDDKMSFGMII